MPRKQHCYHYIYKTTCNVTGRYYIGMHSTSNLEDGYIGSGKRLWLSIQKHGRENHSFEILEHFDDRNSLRNREIEIVNDILREDDLCLNLKNGGDGGWSIEQQSELARRSNAKRWVSEENRKKQAEVRSSWSKKAHKEGKLKAPDWTGKKHREESKKKIGEKNSISQGGERNSQYGKAWITKNGESVRVDKNELAQYLVEGWTKGRKMKRT